MSKPTPGPWRVDNYRGSNEPSLTIAALVNGGWWEVAQAASWGGDGKDQAGANARLIAAAPDLLEAAKDARLWLMEFPNRMECKADTLAEVIENLQAAIAKAEAPNA